MRDTLAKLMDLLDAREKRRFWLLLAMLMAMGAANMVGVAAILPFLAVLARPEMVQTNPWLAAAYEGLGFSSIQDFLMALGVVVFVVYLSAVAVKALATWALIRFGALRNYSIASRILRGYLGQPYEWFLGRHSADLAKTVLAEVMQTVGGVLLPMLNLLANAVIAVAMILLMLLVDPVIALAAAAVFGGLYALIYLVVRRRLAREGRARVAAQKARFRAAQETMAGAKEIKVMGLEEAALARFRAPALRFAQAIAAEGVLRDMPRHILEAVAFGGMLAIVLVLMAARNGDLGEVLPVAGLFALAGSRLGPALQQVFQTLSTIRFNRPTLDVVHADLLKAGDPVFPPPPAPLPLRRSLALRGVRYAYPAAERGALDGLSLEIPAGATVGLVGGTGAGKTTAVDVMLGLLGPQEGVLEVDGRAIEDEAARRAWRRSIGYVPQQIFLIDASVAENVAFGVPPERIDRAAVERAARAAELHDFVVGEMPRGYDTEVGDRGVRLSGGQRQRIGIARALYHDPDVLILDEATSALDTVTERAVMAAVARLGGKKTIVMIAHRLSTVKGCDTIFLLEKGRVAASGTYDELLERSAAFRAMAEGGERAGAAEA